MTRDKLIETIAQAIYEGRNGPKGYPWEDQTSNHKAPYIADANAVIAAIGVRL